MKSIVQKSEIFFICLLRLLFLASRCYAHCSRLHCASPFTSTLICRACACRVLSCSASSALRHHPRAIFLSRVCEIQQVSANAKTMRSASSHTIVTKHHCDFRALCDWRFGQNSSGADCGLLRIRLLFCSETKLLLHAVLHFSLQYSSKHGGEYTQFC